MTQAISIQSAASVVVEPLVLRRAKWPRVMTARGPSFRTIPDTWYAHIEKRGFNSSVVLPIVCCPRCKKMFFLIHTQDASQAFTRMTGAPVPVTHRISPIGEVKVLNGKDRSGDVVCPHPGCGLHRHVYLDQWDKLRPLYVAAYTEGSSVEVKFAYSHATSMAEARYHLGAGKFNVISVGRAVGFLFDEKTNKTSAD
jgi:hypothetical protein